MVFRLNLLQFQKLRQLFFTYGLRVISVKIIEQICNSVPSKAFQPWGSSHLDLKQRKHLGSDKCDLKILDVS